MFKFIYRSEAVEVVTTTEESSDPRNLEVVGCTGTTSLTNGVLAPLGPKQGQIYDEGSIADFYCASGYLVDPDRNEFVAKVKCTAVPNPDGSVTYRWRFYEYPNSKGCAEGKLLPRGLKHVSSINFHPSKMLFKLLLGCNPQDPGGCPSRMTCDPTTRKCRYLSCDSSIENGVLKYFANETLITSKNVRHPNAVGHTAHVSCNEGHLINHVEEYEWLRDFKHYDIQGSMANGNQNH